MSKTSRVSLKNLRVKVQRIMRKIIFLTSLFLLIHSTFAGRLYDPEFGRWLNRDPIGVNGGINIYNSVSNNMVNGFSGGISRRNGMSPLVGNLVISYGLDSEGRKLVVEDPEEGSKFDEETKKDLRELIKQMGGLIPDSLADIKKNKDGFFTPNFNSIFLGVREGPGARKPIVRFEKTDFGKQETDSYKDAVEGVLLKSISRRWMNYIKANLLR